jgi:hypothetical protein
MVLITPSVEQERWRGWKRGETSSMAAPGGKIGGKMRILGNI